MILLLAPITWFGPNFFLNLHTSFCPLTHQLRENSVCVVLDTDGVRTLIQHADLDDPDDYFEIRDDASSRYYALPDAVTALAPTGYTARLVPDRDGEIMLNGRLTTLDALP